MKGKRRLTQEERRAITREKLIRATTLEIAEKGYANVKSKDITRRSGVTWGATQHIFGDRETLIYEVAKAASEGHIQRLVEFAARKPGKNKVRALIDMMWDAYHSPEMQAFYEISNSHRNDKKLHRRLESYYKELVSTYNDIWSRILSEFPASPERVATIRQLVILTLSGLSKREVIISEGSTAPKVLDLLEEVVVDALSNQDSRPSQRKRSGGVRKAVSH